MIVTPESADEFISIARFDWLELGDGDSTFHADNKLHAVRDEDWTQDHRAGMEQEWAVLCPVRLACGEVAASAWIPGVFTRMGAERCKGCCRALGYPEGVGSPKNDQACRALLGLPAAGGAA